MINQAIKNYVNKYFRKFEIKMYKILRLSNKISIADLFLMYTILQRLVYKHPYMFMDGAGAHVFTAIQAPQNGRCTAAC